MRNEDADKRLLSLGARGTRDFRAAMEDLARMGMRDAVLREVQTPRAEVHPAPNVPGAAPGMGDLHTKVTEPGQKYWETVEGQRAPLPEGILPARPPRSVFTQPVAWLAPPATAITIDLFTPAAGVELPGGYPGHGPCVDVLRIDVPDRFIVVLDRFGVELEDHASFGDVKMSFQRNRTPLRSYGNFDVQLGRFVRPTPFGSPIVLKHKDQWRMKAESLSAVSHRIWARIQGWAYAVQTITGDGAYGEFNVR